MYSIGQKPGKGRYCCLSCSWSVNLDDDSDRLRPVVAAVRVSIRSTTPVRAVL